MNERYFDKINTAEKAYWLGFILADGCVIWGKKAGNYCLSIGLQRRDGEILSALENDLGGIREPKVDRQSLRLTWYSKYMAQSLIDCGIVPRKSGIDIKRPKIRKNLLSHFWRGVFDGDGMISTTKHVPGKLTEYRFSLAGSRSILASFIEWYTQFGIHKQKIVPAKNQHGVTKTFKIEMSGNRQITALLNALYKNASRFLDRKYKVYQLLVQQNSRVKASYLRPYS